MLCPICKEMIKEGDSQYMLAFEKPYLNLFVHRKCSEVSYEDLLDLFTNNPELVYNISRDNTKTGKKVKK